MDSPIRAAVARPPGIVQCRVHPVAEAVRLCPRPPPHRLVGVRAGHLSGAPVAPVARRHRRHRRHRRRAQRHAPVDPVAGHHAEHAAQLYNEHGWPVVGVVGVVARQLGRAQPLSGSSPGFRRRRAPPPPPPPPPQAPPTVERRRPVAPTILPDRPSGGLGVIGGEFLYLSSTGVFFWGAGGRGGCAYVGTNVMWI